MKEGDYLALLRQLFKTIYDRLGNNGLLLVLVHDLTIPDPEWNTILLLILIKILFI